MSPAPQIDATQITSFYALYRFITSQERGEYKLTACLLEQRDRIVGIEIGDSPRYVGEDALARAIADVHVLWQRMYERDVQKAIA